jgi:type I restriction enzyme S subunit
MNPNWPTKKLGELIIIESGKRPKGGSVEKGIPSIGGEQLLSDGKIDWNNLRYIPEEFYNSLSKGKIQEGDVLVVKDGATTGKTCYVEKLILPRAAVNEHVFILRSRNPDLLFNKFLFYVLFSDIGQRQISNVFHGSTQGGITQKDIERIEIPLPPLEIQKRIVARIEELFEKIDKAKQLREKALEETEQIFQSALQEIFDKGEKKWGTKKLGEILIKNPQYGLTAKSSKEKKKFRYIRITDITDEGKLKSEDPRYIDLDEKEFNKYKLEKEDFLIARTGSVGRVYLHYLLDQPSVFASYFIRFPLDRSQVIPHYIFYYGLSPAYKKKIEETLRIVAQPNINAQEFCNFEIPLPPLPEQKRIVAYLDDLREKIEKLKQLQQKQLEELDELKKSILEKAFQGELVKS